MKKVNAIFGQDNWLDEFVRRVWIIACNEESPIEANFGGTVSTIMPGESYIENYLRYYKACYPKESEGPSEEKSLKDLDKERIVEELSRQVKRALARRVITCRSGGHYMSLVSSILEVVVDYIDKREEK